MSETIGGPACAHLRVSYMTMNTDDGLTRGWWECQTCQARFAPLAAAREEGRLDLEGDLDECNAALGHILGVCRDAGLVGDDAVLMGRAVKSLAAAHAAQLVALRGIYARAVCDSCLQGHALSLTSEGTWGHTVPYGDKPGCYHRDCDAWQIWNAPGVPPAAEAALAKVREGAVRDAVERVRALPRYEVGDDGACGDPDCCGSASPMMLPAPGDGEYLLRSDVLNALGAKGRE